MFSHVIDLVFSSAGFLPHGFCLLDDPWVINLNVFSDLAIAIAYFTIPVFLIVAVLRRRDLTVPSIFLLFSAFILLCGLSHVIEAVTYWRPIYVIHGLTKAMTAAVSLMTAITLWPMLPRLLAAASPAQLAEANRELTAELAQQAAAQAELARFNAELEARVDTRTADLLRANAELEAEIEANRLIARELAVARDQAEQANKVKSLFLASMSHDLRTPLNAIIGFSDLILAQGFGPLPHSRYLGYIDDIHRSGTLLLSLINNILDLSKIEAGKRELVPTPLDCDGVTQACLRLLKADIENKRLDVVVRIEPDTNLVADDLAFRQVMLNLLTNAIKFTPLAGQISIRAMPTAGGTAIDIADTGIGMNEEGLRDALEPFGRLGFLSTRREGAGTGLGLSIVIRLMELHSGRIVIDSTPGVGTTVRLFFPTRL